MDKGWQALSIDMTFDENRHTHKVLLGLRKGQIATVHLH